jgi:hypothetical protein
MATSFPTMESNADRVLNLGEKLHFATFFNLTQGLLTVNQSQWQDQSFLQDQLTLKQYDL